MDFRNPETVQWDGVRVYFYFLSTEEENPAILYHSKVAKWKRTSESQILKKGGKGN